MVDYDTMNKAHHLLVCVGFVLLKQTKANQQQTLDTSTCQK